jgi:hypothetical protein
MAQLDNPAGRAVLVNDAGSGEIASPTAVPRPWWSWLVMRLVLLIVVAGGVITVRWQIPR